AGGGGGSAGLGEYDRLRAGRGPPVSETGTRLEPLRSFLVYFGAVDCDFRRGCDADLDQVTFDSGNGDDDAFVDQDLLAGLAREYEHGRPLHENAGCMWVG